jgi:PHYB activation tagged suppressor 1
MLLPIFILTALFLFFFSVLIKFLHKVWWVPIQLQKTMRAQGVKGPSYKFLQGSTTEMTLFRKQALTQPMPHFSHDIFPRILPHLHSWFNTYGKNIMYWFGYRGQLVVTDTEHIKEILNNKDKNYTKREAEGFAKKLLGNGLVTLQDGEKWFKRRKIANHAFHAEGLKNMVPAMIASVEVMMERWKEYEGKEIEVFEEFRLLTSEVISRTAFGSSYEQGKNIFDMLGKLSLMVSRNSYKVRIPGISRIWKSSDEIESDKLEQRMRESIVEIIEKREKSWNGEADNDFLGMLVKAKHDNDTDSKISIQDIIDECKTFYVAGHETTTSLLSWTIFLLSISTDWQEKARKEVLDLFGNQNPQSDAIPRLKTMNMIINESLRLYPPVVALLRRVKQESRLGKLVVPKNLSFTIPVLALHHDVEIWGKDAQKFNPERFSEGVAKATNNNPGVFLPFGLGPRSCVGLNFATNEAKIALAMILQRYSFTLSPAYTHSPFQILTIRPQHGVQIILHPV